MSAMPPISFIGFVLTSVIMSIILLGSFMFLMKFTTEDRQLRGTMNEYTRLQEHKPLQQRVEQDEPRSRSQALIHKINLQDNQILKQRMGLYERVKQVESRSRKI